MKQEESHYHYHISPRTGRSETVKCDCPLITPMKVTYDDKLPPQDETRITDPKTGGEKGQKSVRLHAVPWEALSELGRVYAFGEGKYDDYNFRKGYAWSLSYDALQRHLGAFWNREDSDRESGLHHLAHAVWHGITLLFFALTERGTDDRPN